MYNILIMIAVLLFSVLAWKDFRLAVFLLLASLPTYLLRFEIAGVPFTLLEALLAVTAIIWILKEHGLTKAQMFRKGWQLPISVLIFAATISIFAAPDTLAALGIWKAYFIEPVLFFFIVRSTMEYYDDGEKVLMSLGLGGLLIALFAIFQHKTGLAIPEPWDIEGRVTSVFPYPNAVGLYLAPIICLGVFGFFRAMKAKFTFRFWFWLILLIVSSLAVFYSETEAAWLTVPASLFVGSLFVARARALTVPIATLIIAAILIVPGLRTPVIEKVTLQDYSGGVRLAQWEETRAMLKDNRLFGAGLSGYPAAVAPYHTHEEFEIFQYPHNIFLNIWSELGILGLVAFAFICIQVMKLLIKTKRTNPSFFWLGLAAFTALLQMMAHGLVDAPYFKNDLALLTWAIIAVLSWTATSKYAHEASQK